MAEAKKPANPILSAAGLAGGVGGWALSKYAGAALWIPFLATLLLLLIFTKTPLRPKFFIGAIVITGGHIAWFLAAGLLTNMWAKVALDILFLSIGIIWLWIQPGLAAVLFLGLVQLLSLAVNAVSISAMPLGSPYHRALTVHCIWRLLAIVALVFGYVKMRRDRAALASPPPLEGAV